jgi:hypothetical protein
MAWRAAKWALAVCAITAWVLLLHAPGTLPWLFIVAAGVAAVILVTSVWNAWPHGGADT